MSRLEARNLRLDLGNHTALEDVSMSVEAGEIVSVMGPSGSGKSTLLHCLAGILRPDAGEVIFDGRRLDDQSESARSRIRLQHMGFVFQFGDLVPELTMLENVRLPLQLLRVGSREATRRARDVLGRLGVGDLADNTLETVSGGEAQRVAVARAIVHHPRVIFADEPTGALDSVSGSAVMDLLSSLTGEGDVSVVLVTHDARVASYAGRNLTLRDGRTTPQRAVQV